MSSEAFPCTSPLPALRSWRRPAPQPRGTLKSRGLLTATETPTRLLCRGRAGSPSHLRAVSEPQSPADPCTGCFFLLI